MKQQVFIIPGWLHTSREWAHAPAQLSDYDVHIIDLPGFGVTPLVSSSWGIPEFAEYVSKEIARIRETRTDAYTMIGHSFGGRLTAYIASMHPAGLGHIILYAAPCLYKPRLGVRVRNTLARTAKKLGIAQLLPDRFKPYDVREADSSRMGAIFRRSVPFSLEKKISMIATPTDILWGEKDASVPLRIASEMHRMIAHSTLTVLPGEGHNVHLDNPTLLYGTLRNLLSHR